MRLPQYLQQPTDVQHCQLVSRVLSLSGCAEHQEPSHTDSSVLVYSSRKARLCARCACLASRSTCGSLESPRTGSRFSNASRRSSRSSILSSSELSVGGSSTNGSTEIDSDFT